MAAPLLETKLHVPRRRRGLVARPRLTERLNRGADSALTLVSASAGFGKTTLLAEWLAAAPAAGRSAAWLSLDQRDNDPALFWRYLVAALQAAALRVARQLVVSLNTVRTLTKNIYTKLGVNNRRAVVRRAGNSTCCRVPATADQGASEAHVHVSFMGVAPVANGAT